MRDRPLVDLEIPADPADVLGRFKACLDGGDCTCEGHVGKRELSLVLKGEERHVFSPWLSMEAHSWRGGTRLRGRFGPHPNLWTLFVFVYSTWVAVFIGGAVFGYVQYAMGQSPWALWVAVGAGAAQAVACGIDLYGRAKGAKQMDILRSFVQRTLPDAEPVPVDAPLPHEGDQALA